MPVKQLIERIELTSSASSITFSSIPQTFAHLVLKVSLRDGDTSAEGRSEGYLNFNSVSTNLDSVTLIGYDNSQTLSATGTQGFAFSICNSAATSNTFTNAEAYISNYTASQAKSYSSDFAAENNSSADYILGINAGLWDNTSAINSIEILTNSSGTGFVTGSSASLYGITRGGDGTVTTA